MSGREVCGSGEMEWVSSHLSIARKVAWALKRRYLWLEWEELYSYSLWGMTRAAWCYRCDAGASFPTFARGKAMFAAIDAMRQDRVLERDRPRKRPRKFRRVHVGGADGADLLAAIPDGRSGDDLREMEARDLVKHVLSRLGAEDRRILLMYYADGLTFREIGRLLGLSESGVSVRHKSLISRLRTMLC